MALDTLFFDLKINDMTDEQMKAIKSRLEKQLGLNLDLGKQIQQSLNNSDGIKVKVGANTEALENALKRISELVSKSGMSKSEISELNAITKSIKEINSEIEKESSSNSKAKSKEISDAKILEEQYLRLYNAEQAMRSAVNGEQTSNRFKDAISKLQILMFYLKEARGDAEKTNAALSGGASKSNINSALKESLSATKELQKERLDSVKRIEAENNAMIRLKATIDSMELALKRYQSVSNSLGNPQSVEAAIQKMREYIELAKKASMSGDSSISFLKNNSLGMGASNIEKSISTEAELERQRQKAQAAAEAQERLAASHYRASLATDSHTRASLRLGNSLTGLISITGDLRNQIGMLISVYTVEHLLKNVVEIGGEFEKQKLAMGSMLGSLEQADDIFNRMKNLALTSPFNFKDLSNYSRQLTAFGTPYKDLYDTTNRLADISAGLGGDMSRLVLAFSQVKAAAYLRGQEMRQFTEFGVSLPDLLAKKYSEAEHRIVTAGDVIERVSKRMVSFNDVKDVLWKSTDKGGQFYGMQNVLAQSTSGMASNLKDAIDTMYYDIANSNSGMIKGAIKNITELVSHWRELTSVLAAGTFVYTANRLVMAAHNRMLGLNTAETLKGVMASKQEEASLLRHKALYGELSIAEKERLATVNTLTATDLKLLATSKAISADQLMRMVNTKSITATQAFQVASTLELSESEKRYLVTLRALDIQIEKSKLGILSFANAKKQALMFGNKVATIGTDLWSSIKGFFTVPNLAMTAAFVGLDLWMNYQQELERVKQVNDTTLKDARDSYKNLTDFINSNPIDITIKSGDETDIQKLLETYRNQLESSPLEMTSVIAEIDSQTINNNIEKLKGYYKAINDLKQANEIVKNTGDNPFTIANSRSDGGWFKGIFKDELDTNIKDVGNAIMDMKKSFTDFDIDKILNLQSTDSRLQTVIERLKEMKSEGADNYELTKSFYSLLNSSNISLNSDSLSNIKLIGNKEYSDYTNTLKTESEQAKAAIKTVAESMGFDINNMTQSQKLAVAEFARQWVQSLSSASQESKDIFTSQIEDMLFKTDKNMENHTKSWDILGDTISDILRSKGKDIASASQKDMEMATKAAMNQLRTLHPEMSNFINWMSSNLPTVILHVKTQYDGAPKDVSYQNFVRGNLKGSYGSGISKRQNQYLPNAGETAEQFHERMSNAYSDAKKSKEIASETMSKAKQGSSYYHKAAADFTRADTAMSDAMDALQAAGFSDILEKGTPKAKGSKAGGSKTDQFLKDIQTQAEMIKKAVDVYKQGVQSGESQLASIGDIEKLGIFPKGTFDKITSEDELNKWYKNRLDSLVNALRKAKTSNERKKELSTLLADSLSFDRDATKKRLDEIGKQISDAMSETAKSWDNYKQLIGSGMSKSDASNFAFGGNTSYTSKTEAMAATFYDQMAKKGRIRDIGFNITESDARKTLGDDAIGKSLFESWKKVKDEIEKDKIQIQLDGQKAISQIQGIADKIKSTISVALNRSIGINSNTGKQSQLSDYAETGDNGLLKLKDGAEKLLSGRELEMVNSYIEEANQEITKLSSSLLELLPAWDDIFGKAAYKSLSDLLRGMREAKEIISNAKVVNDKNGKPSYFTSSYKDRDGKEQSVSGNIGELDRLKNQTDTRQGDINKKNPFVGMYQSANSYFGAKQQEKKWSDLSKQAEKNGGTTTYTDDKGKKQTITKKDADSKSNDASGQASKASLSFAEALQNSVGKLQTWNNGLSMLGSTIEALGGGSDVSDAAGVAGGMLNGAQSMSGLGPWGMAAGAAMGLISGIASMHDKKLDESIEKSKQKVKELQLAYKQIEDNLKYYLGNAAENTLVSTSDVERVQKIQASIKEIRSKGELNLFDKISLAALTEELKNYSATVKYLDSSDSVNYKNAYNYQRNLYKDQLEQLKQQKSYEEDKKKTGQSKINDYNSQIQDMETKIAQYSEDLANSLYGIDIKGWASQIGDALYAAWQKGESGLNAYKTAVNSIMSNLVKSWFSTNIIEKAFTTLQSDLFGSDGTGGIFGTKNDLTEEGITKIANDIMNAQSDINASTEKLNKLSEELKKRGIDIKNTTDSSTSNAISGVTEQEANIIAAYMDAIRQDTYNNRMNIQKIVESGLKITENPMMQAQLLELQKIESNTYKNMELVGEIKSLFNDITLGNKKVYVN